jgi:hypothetical protein
MAETKTTMYYAGEKFVLWDFTLDPSIDLSAPGTLEIPFSVSKTITIVHGPGIPIAFFEEIVPKQTPPRAAFVI